VGRAVPATDEPWPGGPVPPRRDPHRDRLVPVTLLPRVL